MGNFMGSYHWKTLKDFVTQIFVCVDLAAAVVLETAALPNRCRIGDIVVLTGSDNQWYVCNAVTGVAGDFAAVTPWEASLIANNAIVQFPAVLTVQGVLADTLSGVPPAGGYTGNPFDIVAAATFGVGAGVMAPANDNVEAVGAVIAGTDVTTGALGGVGAGVANPANGNVEAAAQVVALVNITSTLGNIQASAGNIATSPGTGLEVQAAARVTGTAGLQAGVVAGDHVITRIRRSVLNLVGNAVLAAQTTADENLAAVVPATAICIGIQPSAAMVANSVLCPARVNAANVIQIRYANIQAAGNINVAADANFQVLWMDTVAI